MIQNRASHCPYDWPDITYDTEQSISLPLRLTRCYIIWYRTEHLTALTTDPILHMIQNRASHCPYDWPDITYDTEQSISLPLRLTHYHRWYRIDHLTGLSTGPTLLVAMHRAFHWLNDWPNSTGGTEENISLVWRPTQHYWWYGA